jgi:hypothetical protein
MKMQVTKKLLFEHFAGRVTALERSYIGEG